MAFMIKKTTVILSLLMLSPALGFAQSNGGLFVGLNMAKLSGDEPQYVSYKNKPGLYMGASFDLRLTNVAWLSMQPSYSQEGTKVSYSLPGTDAPIDSLSIGLNLFSLPILFKISAQNPRFYAIAGFEAGYLLSSEAKSADEIIELEIDAAHWNFSMHFGAGYKIPVGKPNLYVEARYVQGLLNLTDDPLRDNIIPRVKSSVFKILVGLEIPLTKSKNSDG